MRVPTNVPHLVSRLGVWGKVYGLTGGFYEEIARLSRPTLEAAGIPPDYWYIIVAVRRWLRGRVPFPVVYVLWLLREGPGREGVWARRPGAGVLEAGVAYRYIQLALEAGECPETDPYMVSAFRALERLLAVDGGLRGMEFDDYGEVGTSARAARILALAASRGCRVTGEWVGLVERLYAFLSESARLSGGGACWGRFPGEPGEERCYVGSTGLAVYAMIVYHEWKGNGEAGRLVRLGVEWLLGQQYPEGGWASYRGEGLEPIVDTSFNAARAIYYALAGGLLGGGLGERAREALGRVYRWFRAVSRRVEGFYSMAFALRLASLLYTAFKRGLVEGVDAEWLGREARRLLERLVEELYDYRLEELDYYSLELFGLAVMEYLEAFGADTRDPVLFRIPRRPPRVLLDRYLARASKPSEILYFASYPPLLYPLVSLLVAVDAVSLIVGKLLGVLVALDIMQSARPVVEAYSGPLLLAGLLAGLAAWILLRPGYIASLEGAADTTTSILAGLAVTPTAGDPYTLGALLVSNIIIIDVVSWTADKSLLLRIVRGRGP